MLSQETYGKNDLIVLDQLTEGDKTFTQLKRGSQINQKLLAQALSKLLSRGAVERVGELKAGAKQDRRPFTITDEGWNVLRRHEGIRYIREGKEGVLGFLLQKQSPIDSMIIPMVPKLEGKHKMFIIYSPDIVAEDKAKSLLVLGSRQQEHIERLKTVCHLMLRSFINSGGSQEWEGAAYKAFGEWLP